MKKNAMILLLSSTVIVPLASHAACPTLSQTQLSYYLCPVVGAANVLPQGFTAMVYKRPVTFSLKEFGANVYGTCSKLFATDKTYPGVEKTKTNGKLVCKYTLPDEWKQKANLTKNEFLLEATVDGPSRFEGTACQPLTFDNVSALMCAGTFQIANGPVWSLQSKDTFSQVCKIFKGLVASLTAAPTGTIYGQIDEAQSTPFTHTCEYTYHPAGTERKVELTGTLDMNVIKTINNQIRQRGH
jgi:hypothetical protein